ncbi:Uu.00g135020.m01.CDS01 [Anthostomella pinea]|uniref:Uu.00g135020.m01.CDS01 n=1 Tax=Anthostomella pinea TaxID=933095 RepID=A0AAI8YKV1_9PEZI|nr:Uu.00g135020.m01.CDS01 [Anthostomella pinea]
MSDDLSSDSESDSSETFLRGSENWSLSKDALLLPLYKIGWEEGGEASREGDLTIAEAIINPCKASPLNLISGLTGGANMISCGERWGAVGSSVAANGGGM